jgi:hypothetical protein
VSVFFVLNRFSSPFGLVFISDFRQLGSEEHIRRGPCPSAPKALWDVLTRNPPSRKQDRRETKGGRRWDTYPDALSPEPTLRRARSSGRLPCTAPLWLDPPKAEPLAWSRGLPCPRSERERLEPDYRRPDAAPCPAPSGYPGSLDDLFKLHVISVGRSPWSLAAASGRVGNTTRLLIRPQAPPATRNTQFGAAVISLVFRLSVRFWTNRPVPPFCQAVPSFGRCGSWFHWVQFWTGGQAIDFSALNIDPPQRRVCAQITALMPATAEAATSAVHPRPHVGAPPASVPQHPAGTPQQALHVPWYICRAGGRVATEASYIRCIGCFASIGDPTAPDPLLRQDDRAVRPRRPC